MTRPNGARSHTQGPANIMEKLVAFEIPGAVPKFVPTPCIALLNIVSMARSQVPKSLRTSNI